MISYSNKSKISMRVLVPIVLLLLVGVIVIVLSGKSDVFRSKEKPAVSGNSFSTKGEINSKTKSPTVSSTNSSSAQVKKADTSSLTLVAPTGSFVSNHQPNLDGSPAPNLESSVCNTTPGATCMITFTKDGATKSLEERTADVNGSVYWDWKIQDIGLTVGIWKIQAVASLNGKSLITADAVNLKVSE